MKSSALARLQNLSENSKLPHAWLFVGTDLELSQQFAQEFSSWVLCLNKHNNIACGSCKSCVLFKAATHPDFYSVTLEEDHNSILVDSIRNLNNFLDGKPQLGSKKIVLLYPAEKMNLQAANALLKNLEEPGENTILLLLTRHMNLLLDTIVSRCAILRISPAANNAVDYDPAQFQQFITDLQSLWLDKAVTPIELCAGWVKRWPNEVLYWFELVLADLILCLYSRDPALAKHIPLSTDAAVLCEAIADRSLWRMLEKVQQARYNLGTGHKANLQLVLEDVLLE